MDYYGYGKILLIGGYSVLERPNVSLVLAVDSKVHAKISELKEKTISILIPQFKLEFNAPIQEFFSIKPEGKGRFVICAVKTCLDFLRFREFSIKPFKLTTKSDPEFSANEGKSGLGSSAAVTVAVVRAVLGLHGITDLNEIHKLAQFAHSLAQGKVGSGFDVAASLYGSIKYVRYSPELINFTGTPKVFTRDLDCVIAKAKIPKLHLVFANIPNSSMETVSAVSKVLEFKSKNPAEYENLMKNLNNLNEAALDFLLEHWDSEDAGYLFKEYFEDGRKLTRELGLRAGVEVEPTELSKLISESYENGACVCKLPGAGGRDSIVALCSTSKDASKLKKFWKLRGLNVLNLKLVE